MVEHRQRQHGGFEAFQEANVQENVSRSFSKYAELFRLLLAAVMLSVLSHPALAQVDQGTITGAVLDQTGAVLPQVDITLTSTDTGLILKAKTDASGVYTFSPFKIGNYTVSASAPNFQTATLTG